MLVHDFSHEKCPNLDECYHARKICQTYSCGEKFETSKNLKENSEIDKYDFERKHLGPVLVREYKADKVPIGQNVDYVLHLADEHLDVY